MSPEPKKVRIDQELAQDPNYIAYKGQEKQLKKEHLGRWVAFINGDLVAIESDKESLFKVLDLDFPGEGALVKEIVAEERIYHMGGPRRVH